MSIASIVIQRLFFLQVHSLRLLIYTGITWLLYDPLVITQVSFQLSYLATLGIIVFSQRNSQLGVVQSLESGVIVGNVATFSVIKALKEALFIGSVAQLYTTPVIWYYFGQYPLISLLANTVLYWLPPLLITLGTLAFFLFLIAQLPVGPIDVIANLLLLLFSQVIGQVIVGIFNTASHLAFTLVSLPSISGLMYIMLLMLLIICTILKYLTARTKRVHSRVTPEKIFIHI